MYSTNHNGHSSINNENSTSSSTRAVYQNTYKLFHAYKIVSTYKKLARLTSLKIYQKKTRI